MSARPISFILQDFPDHAAVVGDMLLGFATLEYLTIQLVGYALEPAGNIHMAARILYRLRGANDRLNVADAILRPFMARLKLAGAYTQWLGAMRRCRTIRNQYAHCGWWEEDGALWFSDMVEGAQSVEGNTIIYHNRIDLSLLKEQQAYFDYALQVLAHLIGEAQYRTDRRRTKRRARLPKSRAAPKLYNHPD